MKCTYCKHDIIEGAVTCSHCGRHVLTYEKFKIDKLNWVLIAAAIIQLLIFLIFLVRLLSGFVVLSYLDSGEYENASVLMSRYAFLQDNNEITEKINTIISDTENAYLDESISYENAVETLNGFSDISAGAYQQLIYKTDHNISTVHESRLNIELGDSALSSKNYDSAITYYEAAKISNNADGINEKIENVINKASAEFRSYADKGSYSRIMDIISDLKGDCVNSKLAERLQYLEKKYLLEWIEYKKGIGDYFSSNGVLFLSLRYDSEIEGSSLTSTVDEDLQSYIQQRIEAEDYRSTLNKLNSDYDNICRYPDYFNSEVYNNYRVICASKLVENARNVHKYTGSYGAIKLCDKLNSYKEGMIDKNAVINEFTSLEKAELLQWINNVRAARGLPVLNSNSVLESVALEMAKYDTYDSNVLQNLLISNGIIYTMSCSVYSHNMSSELEFGNCFDPIDNYEILTQNEFTEIGIGMVFDEQNETFSMFIIGIQY